MTGDLYQTVLDTLASTSTQGSSAATVQGLLAQLDQTDPRVKLVAHYLQRRADEAAAEGGAPSPASSADLARTVRRLRRQMKSMSLALETLCARNESLAAALGACDLCWGEDPDCRQCGGAGQPGHRAPDKALFKEWVSPAVRALRALQGAQPGS